MISYYVVFKFNFFLVVLPDAPPEQYPWSECLFGRVGYAPVCAGAYRVLASRIACETCASD